MKPVVKYIPGTYVSSEGIKFSVEANYPKYREAKPSLVENLGPFCSYCENAYSYSRDLDVEHIQPKNFKKDGVKVYAHLETAWSNFLLSCTTCNGSDNKDTKDVVLNQCHLPHLNNTFKSFVYKAGGVVEVNPALQGLSHDNAVNLMSLVRLDKSPATSCPGDTRWLKRTKDWDQACKYREKYDLGTTDIDTIVDLVGSRGGWSIWFTVFQGCDDVRKALLDFPGTAKGCFDPSNHYEPIDRNPGQVDPV